jgi:hypothetical protein
VEGHRALRAGAVALAAVLATAGMHRAHADDVDAWGSTTPDGVRVVITRADDGSSIDVTTTRPVGGGPGGSPRSPAGLDCQWELIPWFWTPGTQLSGGGGPTPQHRRFLVVCGTWIAGSTWVGPAEPAAGRADLAVATRALAQRVVRDIPIGPVDVAVRPAARGVTGIASLFWVEGYDGAPVERRVDELGVVVDVVVALDSVAWDFGDGTRLENAGLGQAWPARSSVRHTWSRSSSAGGRWPVVAEVTLEASYRVDGGPWQALAPLRRRAELPYAVHEVEAVRDR